MKKQRECIMPRSAGSRVSWVFKIHREEERQLQLYTGRFLSSEHPWLSGWKWLEMHELNEKPRKARFLDLGIRQI